MFDLLLAAAVYVGILLIAHPVGLWLDKKIPVLGPEFWNDNEED
jgi:hypothetical protein